MKYCTPTKQLPALFGAVLLAACTATYATAQNTDGDRRGDSSQYAAHQQDSQHGGYGGQQNRPQDQRQDQQQDRHDDHHGGQGDRNDHGGNSYRGDNHNGDNRFNGNHGQPGYGAGDRGQANSRFGNDDRGRFQRFYGNRARYWQNRRNRPRFYAGQHIPGNYRITPVPENYWRGGTPPPPGYRYGYYDGYVVSYNPTTRIIADVLDLAAASTY